MNKAIAVAPILIAALAPAQAEMVPIASGGQWTAFSDTVSPTKDCVVQTTLNGGRFTLSGATDYPGVLRLNLYKATWHIPGVNVPIELSFPGGVTFNFLGVGTQSIIHADVPAADVKSFIHHFTADTFATMALPEGHEATWQLDLAGTTPTVGALARCLETAQNWLPLPFPQQPAIVSTPTIIATQPPTARAPSLSPHSSRIVIPPGPVHVTISAVSGGLFPTIGGTTNLPNGTTLLVSLMGPYLPDAEQRMAAGTPGCDGGCTPVFGPDGISIGIAAIAKSGRFTAGPFSAMSKEPLKPGRYGVLISVIPDGDFNDPDPSIKAEFDRFKGYFMGNAFVSDAVGPPQMAEMQYVRHETQFDPESVTIAKGVSSEYTDSELISAWKEQSPPIFNAVAAIERAYHCGILDNITANVAINKLSAKADYLALNLHVVISHADMQSRIKAAVARGRAMATSSDCQRLQADPSLTYQIKTDTQAIIAAPILDNQ